MKQHSYELLNPIRRESTDGFFLIAFVPVTLSLDGDFYAQSPELYPLIRQFFNRGTGFDAFIVKNISITFKNL
jgi:hypothetical protein